MVQGLGVCIASFAIFITYIVFGLMSPRNKSKKVVLSSLLLYFFCWVSCILIYAFKIESHYYYVRELNPIAIATMVQICIQFFVFYNVVYGKFFENRINLEHSVISVSQSQIQPHFVNNVLYNIKVLYQSEPERAERMLDNLSKFLKGNKDAFDTVSHHPFERELEHIECYLEIEMERFDNISVVYDIGVKDFSVPPLTLQPIVENSIQHGLRAKKSGGTITISTWKDEGKIYISVKDNGIGFDMIKPKDTKRKHLGIENTKFRIEKICNGTLDVKSIVNAGTEVLITIPSSN